MADGSLENFLKRRKQNVTKEEFLQIFISIVKIVKVLHYNRCIHNDIQIKNILVKSKGNSISNLQYYLIDFSYGIC